MTTDQDTAAAEKTVYLNGQFLPRSQASLDIEERGVFFADGVYEVVRYFNGQALGMDDHLERLERSLEAIRLEPPPQTRQLDEISDELIRRNATPDATVYWQITRGSAPRDAAFPVDVKPTLLAMAYPAQPLDTQPRPAVLSAILTPDLRWHRCDIKSLMLLANVLAKNAALDAGADEAILHRDDVVTEGTATSVCIVHRGELWTHPADHEILDGITRRIVLRLARELGIATIERPFTVDQLLTADEVLICGTTKLVAAVGRVGDHVIRDGVIGPVTQRLYTAIANLIRRQCHLSYES